MRRIISAQSWDSVPPAPGLMVIKQELRSWGPESMRWNSAASTALLQPVVHLGHLRQGVLVLGLFTQFDHHAHIFHLL